MSKKAITTLILIVIIAAVAIGLFFLLRGGKAPTIPTTPVTPTPPTINETEITPEEVTTVEEEQKTEELILPGPSGLGGQTEGTEIIVEGIIDEKKWEIFRKSMKENEILAGERPYDFSFEYPSGCRIGSDREGVMVYCPGKKNITILGPLTFDMELRSKEVFLKGLKERAVKIIDENYRTPSLTGIIYRNGYVYTSLWDEENKFMVDIYLEARLYDQDPQFKAIYQRLVRSIEISVGSVKQK